MKKERLEYFSLLSIGLLSFCIILFVGLKYIIPVVLPFIIALGISVLTDTPAKRIAEYLSVPVKIIRLFLSLMITLTVFFVFAFLGWQIASLLKDFLSDIGDGGALYDFLTALTNPKVKIFGESISEELSEKISEVIGNLLSSLFSFLGSFVTGVVGGVPKAMLFLLVTVIALVYFSLDLERISGFFKKFLPLSVVEILSRIRNSIISVSKKYVRSYFVLFVITYSLMFFGFLILGVKKAPLIALLVACLDVLPVVGVGTVLIPWGIFLVSIGNRYVGIGLFILFVINTVVRQLSEPKIVGKNLNIHPIVSLIILYVGYALFGFGGLLLLPLTAILFREDNTA